MFTKITFFDMNMRVVLSEPLQLVCWNYDINHFSDIKVGVLESVSDIKNSSSYILRISKVLAGADMTGANKWEILLK